MPCEQTIHRARSHLVSDLLLIGPADYAHLGNTALTSRGNKRVQELLLLLRAEPSMVSSTSPSTLQCLRPLAPITGLQTVDRTGTPAQGESNLGSRQPDRRAQPDTEHSSVVRFGGGLLQQSREFSSSSLR
jgi:hypothetical protein